MYRNLATRSGKVTIEKRADGQRYITGYAAVFYRDGDAGTEYELGWGVVERIAPTAFNRAIAEQHDARALFNHDPNFVLGRVSAGTVSLSVDSTGLRYEIPVDEQDPDHLKVVRKIERGDIDGSSFGMIPKITKYIEQSDMVIREIADVDLFDVSPVTFPAYQGTSAGLRGFSINVADSERANIERELAEWRASNQPKASPDVALAIAKAMRPL